MGEKEPILNEKVALNSPMLLKLKEEQERIASFIDWIGQCNAILPPSFMVKLIICTMFIIVSILGVFKSFHPKL